jgi:hypothetical protein
MYFALAIIGFLFLLQVAVGCWEKRLAWPYEFLSEGDGSRDYRGYGAMRFLEASGAGFTLLGRARDIRGGIYQTSFMFLLSPERNCLVVIGTGTVLKMNANAIVLHSPGGDGMRSHYTTDNQTGVEIDVTGLWKSQLIPNANFDFLRARHNEWLQKTGVSLHYFCAGRELEEFRRIRENHFDALGRKGGIAFIDSSRTYWRYTLRGSIKMCILNYSIGLIRGLTGGKFPKIA